MHKRVLLLVGFLFSIGFVPTAFSQCAMCKAVIENGDQTMAESINTGISYLMVFPYILVGTLLFFIYRYKKRQQA